VFVDHRETYQDRQRTLLIDSFCSEHLPQTDVTQDEPDWIRNPPRVGHQSPSPQAEESVFRSVDRSRLGSMQTSATYRILSNSQAERPSSAAGAAREPMRLEKQTCGPGLLQRLVWRHCQSRAPPVQSSHRLLRQFQNEEAAAPNVDINVLARHGHTPCRPLRVE